MIAPWQIYLIGQCDKLWTILVLFALVSSVVAVVTYIQSRDPCTVEEDSRVLQCWARRCFICAVVLWPLFALVPDSRTAAAMYVVPAVVNNDIMQKDLPEAVRTLLQKYIDKASREDRK